MKKLYKMDIDLGRQGSLEGLFIADEKEVDNLIGKYVHFGEVLGKHSDVGGTLEEDEFTVVSDDQEKIAWLQGLLGSSVSGFNPFDYLEQEDDEDFDEEAY